MLPRSKKVASEQYYVRDEGVPGASGVRFQIMILLKLCHSRWPMLDACPEAVRTSVRIQSQVCNYCSTSA